MIGPVAQAVDGAVENAMLAISGNVQLPSGSESVQFDRAMLEALPQTKIVTMTPWTDGEVIFEGPLLSAVLEQAGARGRELEATALNEYKIVIPFEDVTRYPVILALKMNGEHLRVRTKGPLWVIYPWNDYSELQSESYYSRSIWQLRSLNVR
jgi:hypothetical protein